MWDEIIFPQLQWLKFGKRYLCKISSHILLGTWLFIHAGIKVNPYKQKGSMQKYLNSFI